MWKSCFCLDPRDPVFYSGGTDFFHPPSLADSQPIGKSTNNLKYIDNSSSLEIYIYISAKNDTL